MFCHFLFCFRWFSFMMMMKYYLIVPPCFHRGSTDHSNGRNLSIVPTALVIASGGIKDLVTASLYCFALLLSFVCKLFSISGPIFNFWSLISFSPSCFYFPSLFQVIINISNKKMKCPALQFIVSVSTVQ